jgi:hypothetical protein
MASTAATNQDTLVTLKINIEGSNRRFKLPLRDLGASTLPDKVRRSTTSPPCLGPRSVHSLTPRNQLRFERSPLSLTLSLSLSLYKLWEADLVRFFWWPCSYDTFSPFLPLPKLSLNATPTAPPPSSSSTPTTSPSTSNSTEPPKRSSSFDSRSP